MKIMAQYLRLGVPVYASYRGVVRAARQQIPLPYRNLSILKPQRHAFYYRMLAVHAAVQAISGAPL